MDDIAGPLLALRQIMLLVLVTLNEHKWVILGERRRISGPLLDRIDIQMHVPEVPFQDLTRQPPAEKSETIRARVVAARLRQLERFRGTRLFCNARMGPRQHCRLDAEAKKVLERSLLKMGFSAPGSAYFRR